MFSSELLLSNKQHMSYDDRLEAKRTIELLHAVSLRQICTVMRTMCPALKCAYWLCLHLVFVFSVNLATVV